MHSETRSYRTGSDEVVLDLTQDAVEFVADRGDGLLQVFVPHATAGIAVIAPVRTTTCWRRGATCCPSTTGGATATALRATVART